MVAFGGVGVDGDKDVRTAPPCACRALLQRDVGVAVAGEEGAEAFSAVELFFQAVRDLQDDVFFAQAGIRVDRAGVFAAVARVDGNHNGALGDGGRREDFVLFFDSAGGGDVALNGNGRRCRNGFDVRRRTRWRGDSDDVRLWTRRRLRQRRGLHKGRWRGAGVR